mmetsp:Transcript_34497/g.63756  ORF Transcript_34497/g.63756 Transcript_34497/m.63756 type:complete len:460 (-) Transcript_34497:1664-3043(-)
MEALRSIIVKAVGEDRVEVIPAVHGARLEGHITEDAGEAFGTAAVHALDRVDFESEGGANGSTEHVGRADAELAGPAVGAAQGAVGVVVRRPSRAGTLSGDVFHDELAPITVVTVGAVAPGMGIVRAFDHGAALAVVYAKRRYYRLRSLSPPSPAAVSVVVVDARSRRHGEGVCIRIANGEAKHGRLVLAPEACIDKSVGRRAVAAPRRPPDAFGSVFAHEPDAAILICVAIVVAVRVLLAELAMLSSEARFTVAADLRCVPRAFPSVGAESRRHCIRVCTRIYILRVLLGAGRVDPVLAVPPNIIDPHVTIGRDRRIGTIASSPHPALGTGPPVEAPWLIPTAVGEDRIEVVPAVHGARFVDKVAGYARVTVGTTAVHAVDARRLFGEERMSDGPGEAVAGFGPEGARPPVVAEKGAVPDVLGFFFNAEFAVNALETGGADTTILQFVPGASPSVSAE